MSNSLSSIVASGLMIVVTVFLPAILVRAISRSDYDLLATVLSVLPLLSIIPQALRTSAVSQLALAESRASASRASRVYLRFTLLVMAGLGVFAVIAIEAYCWLNVAHQDKSWLLRLGLYCVAGHALGLAAIGLSTGPAAVRRDFLPENVAKLWPGFYHLVGAGLIWLLAPSAPLLAICLVYLTSSWTVAVLLALRLWPAIFAGKDGWRDPGLMQLFFSGLKGAAWWNLTAWMATSASLLIVSLQIPEAIVPFSIASSVLGITSAGLIALSGPLSGYAVGLHEDNAVARRRFFLRVNTLFQAYIVTAGLVVLLMPQALFVWWLQPGLADDVRRLCFWLLPSFLLRLMTMAFTVMVMSAGRQAAIWLSPMVEAILSVVGCLAFGAAWGVPGIALALTLSAGVRLGMLILHDEKIMADVLKLRRGDTLLSGLRLLGER